MSSECASTESSNDCAAPELAKRSPMRTPRCAPGTKSVRVTVRPGRPGSAISTWPQPLVNCVAGPIHWPSIPAHTPSSSLIGGAQMPPISPRVWKPMAG